jgi:hypothetical protein
VPGTTECTSGTQQATCETDGGWSAAVTCTDVCVGTVGTVGGACGGACSPGTTQCTSDTQVETCAADGGWESPTTCTYACVGATIPGPGNCGGSCVPGSAGCSGLQPQTCNSSGAWVNNGDACPARQTCSGGVCTGVDCSNYTAPICGDGGCDLTANTCCVTPALPAPTGACEPGTSNPCDGGASPFHCAYACDCVAGDSCCGAINTTTYQGSATCQAVPSGGSCTGPLNEATAQLCKQDSECQNGQPCIAQSCLAGAMFHFCGVQSQPPFRCVAIDGGQ